MYKVNVGARFTLLWNNWRCRTVFLLISVPVGSPSRGGDVKGCVLDINQLSLPTPFILFLCLFLSYGPFTCISFHKSSRQPRSGELRTQKLKSHLVRTQGLDVLPLKPRVGQYIAIHATLTARDFFLAYSLYHSGPFTCIFSKPLPLSPVLAVANTWLLRTPAD